MPQCDHRRKGGVVTRMVPRELAHEWILAIRPGCGDCPCCGVWEEALSAALGLTSGWPLPRERLIGVLLVVVDHARAGGFYHHQKATAADTVEAGSVDPAPDTAELLAELALASAELSKHAANPTAARPIQPLARFEWSAIRDRAVPGPMPGDSGVTTATDRWDDAEFQAFLGSTAEDLVVGAIIPAPVRYAARCFIAWNGDKPRACVNLRPVNRLSVQSTVRYSSARELAAAGRDWHVKLDIKAAFRHVAVPPGAARYLGFRVDATCFQYKRLPFGWAHSPEVFVAALRPTIDMVRNAHPEATFVVYVDDIAVGADDPATAVRAAVALLEALRIAGWSASAAKCFLRPVRILRFLGMRVRGGAYPGLAVAPSLVDKAERAASALRKFGCPRQFLSVWGITSFAATATPWIALVRSAMDGPAAAITTADSCDHRSLSLDFPELAAGADDAVRMMRLAVAEGFTTLGTRYRRPVIISVDTSATGHGGVMNTPTSFGVGRLLFRWAAPLSPAESLLPSAVRELMGAARAIENWAHVIRGRTVVLRLDAAAAVHCVASWSSRSEAARVALNDLLGTIRSHDIDVMPEWWSRESETLRQADALSRVCSPPEDRLALSASTTTGLVSHLFRAPTLHHDALPGYISAPGYTAEWPLLPVRAQRSAAAPRWCGAPALADWAYQVVWAHPTAHGFAEIARRYLSEAAAAPVILCIVAGEFARASRPELTPLWKFFVGRRCAATRGSLVRLARGGEWQDATSHHTWFVYQYAAGPGPDGPRVLSTREVEAFFGSAGTPPHPGPQRSGAPTITEVWRSLAAGDGVARPAMAAAARACEACPEHRVIPSLDEVLTALAHPGVEAAVTLAVESGLMASLPVRDQVVAAIAEVDAEMGPSTQARASRVAHSLLHFARSTAMAGVPWSPTSADALATSWARARLGLPDCRPVRVPPASPQAVSADLSAVAARARRRFPYGPDMPAKGMGPLSSALLLSQGSAARHEASHKRVVWGWELRWGIHNNPAVVASHPDAVAALVTTGALMWRSVYVRLLRRCDVRAYGTAAVFRWMFPHKTNRHASKPGVPTTYRLGFVAATWVLEHIHTILSRDASGESTAPFFADQHGRFLSYAYLSRVLRMLLAGLPLSEEATLHGLRVGCDAELREAGVEDEVRDWMGWWKRTLRRMSEHYEALSVTRLLAAGAKYGLLYAESLAPGLMAAAGQYDAASPAPWHPPRDAVDPRATARLAHGSADAASGPPTVTSPSPRGRHCSRCHQRGHYRSTCPAPLPPLSNNIGEDDSESGVEDEPDDVEAAWRRPEPAVPAPGGSTGAPLVGSSLLEMLFSRARSPGQGVAGPLRVAREHAPARHAESAPTAAVIGEDEPHR